MTEHDVDNPHPSVAERRPLPGPTAYVVWGVITLVWVLLDQATKVLAVAHLSDRTISLGAFDLRLVRNPGGAFGIPGFPGLFVIVTVVVVVLVVRALPRTDRLWLAVAYGLVSGGAIGNVVDRIVRAPGFPSGHVVDFFDLRWWPVFNVADIGITSGAALVFFLLLAVDREERAAQARAAASPSVRPETASPQPHAGGSPRAEGGRGGTRRTS